VQVTNPPPQKKIYTRAEFDLLRSEKAEQMSQDVSLREQAMDLLSKADEYYWLHQFNWMGEPCIQLPQDLFAIQEIIFRTRPQVIIEVGVAWGGSLLFYATLLESLGIGKVIGIDIFIPPDLKERLMRHGKISERLHLLEGSSLDHEIIERVKQQVGDARDVMVILDSNHTHEHVLQELLNFSPFVKAGNYLICADTVVEYLPPQKRQRAWGPGNNPYTALQEFLQHNDRFRVAKEIDNKLLLSCQPRGYLECIKD
jgi:cephalosporin hydroxylase